ncbi:MAG: hypothetical protein WCW30_05580 [Candidatus Gracilibacteria bacterium]
MNWQRPKEKPPSQTEVLQTLRLHEGDMVFAKTSAPAGGIQRFYVNQVFPQRGNLDVLPVLLNGKVDRATTGGIPTPIRAQEVVAIFRNGVWNITEAGEQLGISLASLDKHLTPPAPSPEDVKREQFRQRTLDRVATLKALGVSTRR